MISEPTLFCRPIECSGVRSLKHLSASQAQIPESQNPHWRSVVWAQEADAFFGDLCKLEQGDHLEPRPNSVSGLLRMLLIGEQIYGPATVYSYVLSAGLKRSRSTYVHMPVRIFPFQPCNL